jgi:hypothetical protein
VISGPDTVPDEILDITSWDELSAAARAFAAAPLSSAWERLEVAALRRALARIKLTGERFQCRDLELILQQLVDRDLDELARQ